MNRISVVAVVALGALLAGAGARTASQSYQDRLEAFRTKQDELAKEQKLDWAARKKKYPTPELTLVRADPSGDLKVVRPGDSVDLQAQVKAPTGALVLLACEDVEVLSEELKGEVWKAKVKVAKTFLPGTCQLKAYSPVSVIGASKPAFRVEGRYRWELKLSNGWTTQWETTSHNGPLEGTSQWKAPGGAPLGTRDLRVSGSGKSFSAEVLLTDEEQARMQSEVRAAQSDASRQEAMKALQTLTNKMSEECGKLAPAKMGPCFEKYQKQIDPIAKQLNEQGNALNEKLNTRAVGCDQLSVTVEGGVVKGHGQGCGAPGRVEISGMVTAMSP